MEQSLRLAYCMWPMLCPPNDWTDNERGGYLTEDIRQMGPLVRKSGKIGPPKQGDIPLDFLNNLQRVSYRLNPGVLAVANTLFDSFTSVGKMIRMERLDPPPAIPEDADEYTVKEYKLRAAELKTTTPRSSRRTGAQPRHCSSRTCMPTSSSGSPGPLTIGVGSTHKSPPSIRRALTSTRHSSTSQTRVQPTRAGSPGTWPPPAGHDKLSHEDRKAWTRDNLSLITAIAHDPIGNISPVGERGRALVLPRSMPRLCGLLC